jgi:hypothetical protein
MFKMSSYDPFEYLKYKLWQFDSQPLKFEIAPISLRSSGISHIVEKLSMRATTLF